MKRLVEQDVKKTVEAWDEKSSDIGYDKDFVWDSIQANTRGKSIRISWQQIAVAVIITFLLAGWGRSEYANMKLQQSTVTMANEIQTLNSKVKPDVLVQNEPKYITKIVRDTIEKIIIQEVFVNASADQLTLLKQQHQQSLANAQSELVNTNEVLQQLQDSLATVRLELQAYKQTEINDDIKFEINEAALVASLENKEGSEATSPQPKNKVKLVLFNKSKSSMSKAPAGGRIRL